MSKASKLVAILLIAVVVASGLGYWFLAPRMPPEILSYTTQQTSLLTTSGQTLTSSILSTVVTQIIPNDPLFGKQLELRTIMAPEAWTVEKGSSAVIVAIVDTGVDYTHPDLKANMWTSSHGTCGWDFVDNDNDPMDTDGHGTQVAGIVAAVCNNGIGVCGVAWGVKIMAVRVRPLLNQTDYSRVAQGIRYAVDNGARIINLSLVHGSGDFRPMRVAIDYAASKGVLVIQAAGNGSIDIATEPEILDPDAMRVAGTDENDRKAELSSFGAAIDVSAPWHATTTTLNAKYLSGGGTSYATPYVAGLAALLFSLHPTWTNTEVKAVIKATADNIDSVNPSYAGKLGAGRINAYRALTEAATMSVVTTAMGSSTTYVTSMTTRIPSSSNVRPVVCAFDTISRRCYG